jgi:hypothetical protein
MVLCEGAVWKICQAKVEVLCEGVSDSVNVLYREETSHTLASHLLDEGEGEGVI